MEKGTDPPDSVRELLRQYSELRARLEIVEARLDIAPRTLAAPAESSPAQTGQAPATAVGDASGVTALAGISVLGLALAYLIRAAVEAKALPAAAGIGIGIVYAAAWLAWAARTPVTETLAISIRALTAALILMPLLWEAQFRFEATSSALSASVLLLFSAFGLGVSRRKNAGAIPAITSLAVAGTAVALLVATKDVLPFAFVLLGLAAAVECCACLGRRPAERWIVAAAADLVVLLLTFVVTRPGGLPPAYVPMPMPGVLAVEGGLLAVYLGATFVRTLGRGLPIANLEIAQCAIAFGISVTGTIQISNGRPAAVPVVGIFCALGAALSYGVSFALEDAKTSRNFHTYACFGLALALIATWLMASEPVRVSVWCALAVIFIVAAGQGRRRMTLKWHACVYLVLGAITAGTALAPWRFFDAEANAPAPEFAVWVATVAAALAYLMLSRGQRPADPPRDHRVLYGILALCAGWGAAGIAAAVLGPFCGSPEWRATVFTAILVLPALGSAFLRRRFERSELMWLAYSLLAVATAKLIVGDLSRGAKGSTVLSLALYGGVMVLLPRVSRKPAAKAAAA